MNRFHFTTLAAAASLEFGAGAFAQSPVDLQPNLLTDPTAFQQAAQLRVNLGMVQDESIAPLEDDGWRADLISWIWLMGVDGDIGARGRTADVSASFSDVLDSADSLMALALRLEVGKGRWAGFFDGMWSEIGVEDLTGPFGLAEFDITMDMILIDFGAMYRVCEWAPGGNAAANNLNGTIDLYAGGRYLSLEVELDPDGRPSRDAQSDIFDPIVGAKLVLPFAEHWHIMALGDVGGFGLESDLTWQATGVLGYDFTIFDSPAELYFGYRAIGWDWSDGSGSQEATWDVILHGPVLGFSFFF